MKNRRILILVIIILLAVVAIWLAYDRSNSTFSKNEGDFAVEDTARITRILLADKRNNIVVLERKEDGKWVVNEEYPASKPILDMFLQTLKNIRVKEPVPVNQQKHIISLLAANAVKVEIYQYLPRIRLFGKEAWFREKRTRVYYVGDATPDLRGSYMLKEGADIPFIVDLPGLRGFVSPRYSTRLEDWRDHTIFHHRLANIHEVTVEIPEMPDQSYKVIRHDDNRLEVISLVTQQTVSGYDTLKVLAFMNSFNNIKFESFLNKVEDLNIDSIRSSQPFFVITLKDNSGETIKVRTFHKKAEREVRDENGELFPWDVDRLYVEINDGKDIVLAQFFTFDKILRPLGYFYIKPSEAYKLQ